MRTSNRDKEERTRAVICEYLGDRINNRIAPDRSEPAYDPPLVGFARGDDPIFETLKQQIGPFYWTPDFIFSQTFPDSKRAPSDLAVVSWILPQTVATKRDQRRCRRYPSNRWSCVRYHGEALNERLRAHVVSVLGQQGIQAVAPALSPLWERQHSVRFGYASSWSERHAAYACGLGTFGLSDGLITPVGKAVRIGSVVAGIEVSPAERPYSDHNAYCLYFNGGTCAKCVERCPAGAISLDGHDKVKCRSYIRRVTSAYVKSNQMGVSVNSCGLCQVKIPCESGIPSKGEGSFNR